MPSGPGVRPGVKDQSVLFNTPQTTQPHHTLVSRVWCLHVQGVVSFSIKTKVS